MNIQPNLRLDKAAFIKWSATAEERYELVGGRVAMMTRPSRAHAIIVPNLAVLLRGCFDRTQWVVVMEFGLDAGPETVRYPDVVVDRVGGRRKDYTAIAPILLAEVLSPSSVDVDLGDKVAEYMQLPGLQAYIVLSQDEPKAWVYARSAAKFAGPTVIAGTDAVVQIDALGLALPMADIYAGIGDD